VARADRQPLALPLDLADTGGRPADIRGAEVVNAFYGALHSVAMIPHLPRIIGDAAAGRYEELTPLVKQNQGPSSSSWGLRLSVWCGEEMPFEDAARIAAQTSPAMGLGGIDEGAASPELCRAWNVAAAAPIENEPVQSDAPALIFAGEFDPDTPPAWGRRLLASMPNAVYVELRGQSHGAGFNACGAQIEMAFLRAPGSPLPVDCALKLRGADFGLSARPKP
jgi:pimeloyl-ACP methyl ester carboxylesterase